MAEASAKRCSACGMERPLDQFFADRSKRSGRSSKCKACQKAYHAEWRSKNREHVRSVGRAATLHLTEEQRERRRRVNQHRRKDRYAADPDYRRRLQEQERDRYARDPTRKRRQATAWAKANRERVGDIQTNRRARKRAVDYEPINRRRVFERDGYVCWLCGLPTEPKGGRALRPTIDHVRPLSKGGAHTYANVRCAHSICNQRKATRLIDSTG